MTCVENIKDACLGLLCLFQVAIAGSTISYVVFAILFLVKDYSICGDASPLWVFVMVSVIVPAFLNLLRIQNQPHNNSQDTDSVTPVAGFLLVITEVIIGGVLIYGDGNTCESMKHTGLWVVALILFWTLLTALLLVTATILTTFVLGVCCESKPLPNTGGVHASSINVTIVNSDENV
jgi:hypothetical protein